MAPRPAARGAAPLPAASSPCPAPAGGSGSPEHRPPQPRLSRRTPRGRPTRAPPRPARPRVSPLAGRPAGAGAGPGGGGARGAPAGRRRAAPRPGSGALGTERRRPPGAPCSPAAIFGTGRENAPPAPLLLLPPPAPSPAGSCGRQSSLKKCFTEAAKSRGVRDVLPTVKMASGAPGIAVPPLARGRGNFCARRGQAAAPGPCPPPRQDHSSCPAADRHLPRQAILLNTLDKDAFPSFYLCAASDLHAASGALLCRLPRPPPPGTVRPPPPAPERGRAGPQRGRGLSLRFPRGRLRYSGAAAAPGGHLWYAAAGHHLPNPPQGRRGDTDERRAAMAPSGGKEGQPFPAQPAPCPPDTQRGRAPVKAAPASLFLPTCSWSVCQSYCYPMQIWHLFC